MILCIDFRGDERVDIKDFLLDRLAIFAYRKRQSVVVVLRTAFLLYGFHESALTHYLNLQE
jgi:hypothetical protein